LIRALTRCSTWSCATPYAALSFFIRHCIDRTRYRDATIRVGSPWLHPARAHARDEPSGARAGERADALVERRRYESAHYSRRGTRRFAPQLGGDWLVCSFEAPRPRRIRAIGSWETHWMLDSRRRAAPEQDGWSGVVSACRSTAGLTRQRSLSKCRRARCWSSFTSPELQPSGTSRAKR